MNNTTRTSALLPVDPHTQSISLGILVLLLSLTGTVANTLSFTYFARKNRSNIARNLTLFLNSADFMVCVWSLLGVFLFMSESRPVPDIGISTTGSFDKTLIKLRNTDLFVTATGYATCLLSATRTISLLRPFWKISGKAILVTNLTFLLYVMLTKVVIATMVAAKSPLLVFINCLSAVEMSVSIATVTICCLMCSYKLIVTDPDLGPRCKISPRNRHGTVTIIIISVLFCVVHLCYLLSNVIWYHILDGYWGNDTIPHMYLLKELSSFAGIPLNSAMNPIIYITRKSDMRRYVRDTMVYKYCTICFNLECCGKDMPDLSESHTQNTLTVKPPFN